MITLLTDFGLQDIYVGVMKGVILARNPQINIVDLSHQIPPHDIQTASFQLASAFPYFPKDTVHVVVVDPGVGGPREAIALNLGDAYVVGPNNGVFSHVLAQYLVQSAVSLDNPNYWIHGKPSATFHGRDIFAPVAAHLSLGVALNQLGHSLALDQLIQMQPSESFSPSSDPGYVQSIDRFGNLITTLVPSAAAQSGVVSYRQQCIPMGTTYADVAVGEAIALVGSHGWIEIAINQGNAQTHFRAALHDPVSFLVSS